MSHIEIFGNDEESSPLRILPEEFDKICRLCLKKNGTNKLFDKKNKHTGGKFNELLSYLHLVRVEENDGLPQNICNACATMLNEFYFFKEQINSTQVILNVALGKVNIDKSEDETNGKIEYVEVCSNPSEYSCEDVIVDSYSEDLNAMVEVKSGVSTNYKCRCCNEEFVDRKLFLKHRYKEYRKKKSLKKIKCEVCQKMIVSDRIKDHMNTHTKERPHICEICGKGFHSAPNLYTHKTVHKDERPHICHLCGKSYKHAPQLTDHLRTHNSDDNFVCDLCGSAFLTRASFRHHRHQHFRKDGEPAGSPLRVWTRNKYPRTKYCDICQKEYSTYQRLAIHMRMHTGEKPFECDVCHKKFTQNAHLTYHMRLHTGEKPYECSFCGKRFAGNGNLQQHMRTHTGEKPHSCDVCDKTFYTGSSLRKHKHIHDRIQYISSESE